MKFYSRSVVPTKYVDTDCLDALGRAESITFMLTNTSLLNLCLNPSPTFEPLVLEFLSSFSYNTPPDDPFTTGTANFRMFNQEYSIDQERVAELLEFTRGPTVHCKPFDPEGDISWDKVGFSLWDDLTGQPTESWRDLCASHIHNPALRYFHRILANIIFGRTNNHKVNQNEMFLIFCALNGQAVNAAPFMLSHFHTCVNAAGTNPFVFGGIITSLAYALGLFDELLSLGQYMMPAQTLDVMYCRDSHLIPNIILPCPNQINVQNFQNWRFNLNAPVKPAAQPDNDHPPATLEAMYATILQQDQRFQAMEVVQNETLRLVREMQRDQHDYAHWNNRNYEAISNQMEDFNESIHALNLRIDGLHDYDSDRRRRQRNKNRGARGQNSPSDE